MQPDGSPVANVVVNSPQDAQYAISQLHHHRLGSKRISISYIQNAATDFNHLRAMVVQLLKVFT